jgi:hypothetical protein
MYRLSLVLLFFLSTLLLAEPKNVYLGAGIRSKEELVEDRILGSSLTADMLRSGRFSAEQVKQVRELIQSVSREGLPIEQLVYRIREGVSKRVDFELLYRVVTKKVEWLRQSQSMVEDYNLAGYKVENKVYCIQLVSELFARGVSPVEFKEFTDIGRLFIFSLEITS